MTNPSLELQQKSSQNIKQLQRLIMSRQMQQAIHFLQVPILELTPLIDQEMEQNPILEYTQDAEIEIASDLNQLEAEHEEAHLDEDSKPEQELLFNDEDFGVMRHLDEEFRDHFLESGAPCLRRSSEQDKLQTFLESSICAEPTLSEHLIKQAHEAFDDDRQRKIAEAIIGSLDGNGFLNLDSAIHDSTDSNVLLTSSTAESQLNNPLEELAILQNCSLEDIENILSVIQTFDPAGVGARNLKDSLLLQLKRQGKSASLAYSIIEKHFDDLLHNRVPAIRKGLHCTAEEITAAIDQDIAKLDLHPGTQISQHSTAFVVPDVSLKQENEDLIVVINDDFMPKLRLNSRYLRMLDDESLSQEVKDFIKKKILSAKWLLRNMMQRNDTLEGIAKFLAKHQRDFFINPDGQLKPLTMKMVAEELAVHESTIARAVSGKYIDSPRGILSLRSFFTSALPTQDGQEVSSKTVHGILKELIATEDKQRPLSDEALSALLKQRGIQCARRTVAKYRQALNIGSAQQRRVF